MLLSTFELLIKPQLLEDFDPLPPCKNLSRTVAQGYFLTIANNTSAETVVSLIFTATTSSVDTDQIFTFVDVARTNIPRISQETAPRKIRFTLPIPADNTCLFILKPDALKIDRELTEAANFEISGHVEIFVSGFSVLRFNRLLLAREHPEIFTENLAASESQAEQSAYTLSTADGSSLFNPGRSQLRGLEGVLSAQSLDTLRISQLS